MATLEGTARPILTSMILGERQVLGRQEQEIVARWGYKTALTAELAIEAPVIPLEHYSTFYREGRPREKAHVLLACFEGSWEDTPIRFDSGLLTREIRLAEVGPGGVPAYEQKSYSSTYAIGHLVLQVIGVNEGDKITMTTPTEMYDGKPRSGGVVPIWPLPGKDVSWPPTLGVNDVGFENLARLPTIEGV